MTYLWAVGHLLLYLIDSIENAGVSVEQQTVCIGDVPLNLFVNTIEIEHRRVNAAILHFFRADDARRHVLRERCAGLYHGCPAYTRAGVGDDRGAEDGAILDDAVAGNLRTVAEDAAAAYLGVVADVRAFHEDVVVANDGLSACMRGAVDDHVLTDDVVVAENALRLFTTKIEILREGTDDTTLMNLVMTTHTCAIEDGYEGEDDAVVANHHVVLDVDEGEYLAVVANLRLGRNLGSWGNIVHKF